MRAGGKFRSGLMSVFAAGVIGAACLASNGVRGQVLAQSGAEAPSLMAGENAPSAMAALLDGKQQASQIVSLALGHQLFVPNEGQWSDATVAYGLHADNWSIAFRDGGEIELILRKAKPEEAGPEPLAGAMPSSTHGRRDFQPPQFDETSITLTFPGCNADSKPVGIHPTPTRINYFVGGKDRENAAGLATYTGIEYPNLYNGIDLFIRGNEADGTLKYEFHVAAGADPSLIHMHYDGLNGPLSLNDEGDLQIATDLGTLIDHAPIVWQGPKKIEATYILNGNDACQISLGKGYDPARPVVIDPEVEWMTYLGGSDIDVGYSIVVDNQGSALITGETLSTDFDGRSNTFHGGYDDAFVAKTSSSGILQWVTFFGGSDFENGNGIALDNAGDALITGITASSDFEGRNNASHSWDAFVVKVGSTSGTLQWMTYLGGSLNDRGMDIAVDNAGNAFVTGKTESIDFEGRNNDYHGVGVLGDDAFVAKVGGESGTLQWMTYLGGSDYDWGYGITVDSAGNALATGWTKSSNFEGRINTYHGGFVPYEDAFVVKISTSGILQWMTYLGGDYDDTGNDIATDGSGSAFVSGWTSSTDFDGRSNGYHGYGDGFIVKINNAGILQWMTYLGGTSADYGEGIAIQDFSNSMVVTGATTSNDFEGRNNAYHGGSRNGGDTFVVKVGGNSGDLQWMTYVGGSSSDNGWGISVDTAGSNGFVTGATLSSDFEGHENAYHVGSHGDAFVVKVSLADGGGPELTVEASCPNGGPIQISWNSATPSGNSALIFARSQGTFVIPRGQPCAGAQLGLAMDEIRVVWRGRSDASGAKSINANADAGACGGYLQFIDLTTCRSSNIAAIQ